VEVFYQASGSSSSRSSSEKVRGRKREECVAGWLAFHASLAKVRVRWSLPRFREKRRIEGKREFAAAAAEEAVTAVVT
jgi:hypothetical protein